jgi:hypothetical protein
MRLIIIIIIIIMIKNYGEIIMDRKKITEVMNVMVMIVVVPVTFDEYILRVNENIFFIFYEVKIFFSELLLLKN